MNLRLTLLLLFSWLLFNNCSPKKTLTLTELQKRIKLPEGFMIDEYASGLEEARAMCWGEKGTLFVGSRGAGKVYAVIDSDNDYKADEVIVIDEGLTQPVGVAFKNGDLYVSAIGDIYKYPGIEDRLNNPPAKQLVTDAFPNERHHGWKFIAFGPDGKLYVPVGAPCNICHEDEEQFANIMRMNADGSELETYAKGVRNTVGFTWHPETKDLWFTDNGRDWMGDDLPPCELNRASQKGMHFGYPFCHGGRYADDEFGDERDCSEFTAPVQNLGAHVAPLGVKFYTGTQFPEEYRNQIFIAEHGSWNRSSKVGYRVTMVKLNGNKAISYEPFAEGWLEGEENYGRPVDILLMDDGSMLVSDDYADKIYRIYYNK